MSVARDDDDDRARVEPHHVKALRLGHGANCSSVGSVVDTLFLGAVAGGAIFAAICAAMRDEPIRIVGDATQGEPPLEATSDDEEPAT
ncbi:MAG TPA: hypothetical protein VM580_15635 [Labilithrix sp.]|nr:hypothetical protein [Labilithrix sp.]